MRSRSEAGRERRGTIARIPHDPINEQVVIAATIAGWNELAEKHLRSIPPENFYGKGHAAIWFGLREILNKHLTYDPATLRQVTAGEADPEYVEQLLRDRPAVPPNLGFHVECLAWDRARLEAATGPISALVEALKDPSSDRGQVRGLAERVGKAFKGFGASSYLRDSKQLVAEQMAKIRIRRQTPGGICMPYGIDGLDFYGQDEDHENAGMPRVMPGAAAPYVTVIAGASGSGKTTTTTRMAIGQAKMKRRVLYAAWEPGSGMTLELCALMNLGMSRTDLMYGRYNDQDELELEAEMERLSEYIKFFELPGGDFKIDKRERFGLNERQLDIVQAVINDSRCEVFIADLFRRALREMRPDDEEQALYRMQAITKEENIATLLLHQINMKELERRPDKRPTLDALKGTSGYVEVGDNVLVWYRPSRYKNVPDTTIEAAFLKQRYGEAPIAVELEWDAKFGYVGGGRSMDYERPGELGTIDTFMAEGIKQSKGPKRNLRGKSET